MALPLRYNIFGGHGSSKDICHWSCDLIASSVAGKVLGNTGVLLYAVWESSVEHKATNVHKDHLSIVAT